MNQNYDSFEIQFSERDKPQDTPAESSETGFTDDERVIREDEFLGDKARAEPGPADFDRIKKT